MKPMMVRIAADWDTSALLSQTPGSSGIWDGIHFTTKAISECDLLVVLNNRHLEDIRVQCPRGNVWCVMQEPYIPGLYDWLIEGLEPYSLVFTHHPPSADPKFVPSHPALPWLVGRDYDELSAISRPDKTESISWIASDLAFLPAHRRRRRLRQYFHTHARDLVHLYGRGIEFLPRKWDGLAPFRYSLCLENSVGPNLWSEKLADC